MTHVGGTSEIFGNHLGLSQMTIGQLGIERDLQQAKPDEHAVGIMYCQPKHPTLDLVFGLFVLTPSRLA
jgi:hypothetical protein